MIRYLAILLCLCAPGLAAAQVGNGVNMGLNGDSDSMSGPAIDMVNGTNANGTPRQLLPGASMTNGAGNSYMTPGVTGGPVVPPRIFAPPTIITAPTLQGQTGGTAPPQ
jgi:hypothetical protein